MGDKPKSIPACSNSKASAQLFRGHLQTCSENLILFNIWLPKGKLVCHFFFFTKFFFGKVIVGCGRVLGLDGGRDCVGIDGMEDKYLY